MKLIFTEPLTEGLIIERKNRFIFLIEINGKQELAHCPSTGSIGGILFKNNPCLVSVHNNLNRKTKYTVEAFSLSKPNDNHKDWIGINQTAANRYVEHFLKTHQFNNMIDSKKEILREKKLGDSRLDFLVDDNFIEVKTPLIKLQCAIPSYIELKIQKAFSSFDRLTKHIRSLADSLDSHQQAIMLTVFLYDNKVGIPKVGGNVEEINEAFSYAWKKGVQSWTCNMKITPTGVELLSYKNITNQ